MFCLDDLCIVWSDLLKNPTTIVLLSISPLDVGSSPFSPLDEAGSSLPIVWWFARNWMVICQELSVYGQNVSHPFLMISSGWCRHFLLHLICKSHSPCFWITSWVVLDSVSENAMATHSSTVAWEIPRTEEPGGVQYTGSLRVGHDWATSLSCIGEGNGNPLQCSCLENTRAGEPGELPSMGLHRVGHDWRDLAAAAAEYTFLNIRILSGSILIFHPSYKACM